MTGPLQRAYVEILPDLRQFTSQLRTGVNEMLSQFSRASNDAMRQGLHVGDQFGNGMRQGVQDETGRLRNDLDRDLHNAGAGARRQGESTGQSFGGGFKSKVLAIVGGLALFSGVSKAFSFAKDAVFGFNSTLEQSTIGFTTMLGSGKKAQTFLDQLQQFAKTTPFEFQGLVQNSQTMLGMGIAAKDIIPDLTALGDSVASTGGNADTLNNTILAFSQTAAKGKVDMGNLNQLLQGGVPQALKILAAGFHVSTGEMVKMISAGKVQSSVALPLLVKGLEHGTKSTAALGGMMDKQSHTFRGALSNINDALTQSLAKAFRPFFTSVSGEADKFATFLSSPKFTRFANHVATAVHNAFATIAPFFHQIGSIFTSLGPGVMQLVRTFNPFSVIIHGLAPVLPQLGQAFGEVAKVIGQNLGPLLKALAPVFREIVGVVTQIARVAIQLLIEGLHVLTPLIPPLVHFFVQLMKVFVDFWHDAIVPALPAIKQIATMLINLAGVIVRALMPIMPTIISAFKEILNAIRPLIPVILSLIKDALKVLIPIIKAVLPPLIAVAKFIITVLAHALGFIITVIKDQIQIFMKLGDAAKAVWDAIRTAFSAVMDFFGGVGAAIESVFHDAIKWLESAGKNIIMGLWNGIRWIWTHILKPFYVGLPLAIAHFFANALSWLADAGKAVLRGLWNGITWLWNHVLKPYFVGIPRMVLGFFSDAVNWLFNAGKSLLRGLGNGVIAIWKDVSDWFRKLPGRIVGFFGNVGKWLYNKGRGILTGLWNGIKSLFTDIVNWFKDLPMKILHALGIASPPKWAINAGSWIMKGLHKGLTGSADAVLHFMGSLGTKFVTGMIGKRNPWMKDLISGLGLTAEKIGQIGIGGVEDLIGIQTGGTLESGLHSGNVLADWARQAVAIAGFPLSWIPAIVRRAIFESSGNPAAINLTDENARAGHPSKGLMQTIDSTFASYAMRGHGNIWNPVDNIIAAIRYIRSRYGSIFNIDPPVQGYKTGAWKVERDQIAAIHQNEMVLPPNIAAAVRKSLTNGDTSQAFDVDDLARALAQALNGMSIGIDINGIARLVTQRQGVLAVKGVRR